MADENNSSTASEAPGAEATASKPEQSSGQSFWLQSPQRIAHDWKVVLGLTVGLMLMLLPGLGSYGLYDPWETHYGEVARNMVEHDNYIDPTWGSPWDPDGVKRERAGFYSKPPLIMWMMSAGMNIAGYTELGVRFFFPLVALLALLAIYLSVSRFYNRRTGLIAVAVTCTAPVFIFLSRQAVPDGPMVAIVTAGMMALALALFKIDDDEPVSRPLYWFTLVLLAIVVLGQIWTMLPMDRSPDIVRPYPGDRGAWFAFQWWLGETVQVARGKGWALALVTLPFAAWAGWRVARQKRRRMMYIYLFYIACGLTVPAKGWLGWAPMGGAILGYLLVSGEWKILKTVDVPTGLLLVFVVGHPWVLAMVGGHPGWYKRFIEHDHINRLFSGVHKIDDGGFEYFFKWIGYGLYPWIGLLPAGLIRVFSRLRAKTSTWTPQQKFEAFVLIWAVLAFFLFTKSQTKFHHYIFPAIPAFAILIALFLEDVIAERARSLRILLPMAAGIVLWVGQDLFRFRHLVSKASHGQGSQNLVNLFTYKYDREWPRFTPDDKLASLAGQARDVAVANNEWLASLAQPMLMVGLVAIAGYLMMAAFTGGRRRYGAVVLVCSGLFTGWWCLNEYLPKVSVHWSQKGMWDTYYSQCEPFGPDEDAEYRTHMLTQVGRIPSKPELYPRVHCKEPVVAFRTNWRGETFYSANTVLPAPETKHLKPFLKQWGNDKPFFLFTESSRVKSELEPNLPKHLKGQYEAVFGGKARDRKFVLLRIDASRDYGKKKPAPESKKKSKKKKNKRP